MSSGPGWAPRNDPRRGPNPSAPLVPNARPPFTHDPPREPAGSRLLTLRSSYAFSDHRVVLARVDNVVDKHYTTFGALGAPGKVFPDFTDPRFYGPGQPRGAWIGIKLAL